MAEPNADAETRELARRFAAVVGEGACISDPAGLSVYEGDGLSHGRVRPRLVVLPASTVRART